MAGDGWAKNWRKIKEWRWYRTPYMAHLFQHLFREANHEERRWQGITIERGQLVTSLASLSKETGISVQSLRTCINRLISTSEITNKSTNKFRIITICNYDSYQDKDVDFNRQTNTQPNIQLTNNQQTTNNKQELKNYKKRHKLIFDEARKLYPGRKKGCQVEFGNFVYRSKHPLPGQQLFNYVEVLPLLKPAIERQIAWRKKSTDFVPSWKNFKTWINNSCWEEEPAATPISQNDGAFGLGGIKKPTEQDLEFIRKTQP